MAPGGNTMRFINRKERSVDGAKRFQEAFTAKAFGRDLDQLKLTAAKRVDARRLFPPGDGTVYESGGEPASVERVYLVFHQGDQGRNDQGRAIKHHGRQLVTERLPAAGRHDHHRVFACQDCIDDLTLPLAEFIESEVA